MRASRLLRILLILQNRGRVSTLLLAKELEVARRTVMRDLEALQEAGLPIITHRGNTGGVELGFKYRSRFVGLDAEEAEALGVLLASPRTALGELGLATAALRACDKLVESLPDSVRRRVQLAQQQFQIGTEAQPVTDARVMALADATRKSLIVRLNARKPSRRTIHPIAMHHRSGAWEVVDALDKTRPVPQCEWGDINISALTFSNPSSLETARRSTP